MIVQYYWLIIIFIIGLFVYLHCKNKKIEGYNDQTGRYCMTCAGKTLNQCLQCFNCGWCTDKHGNSGCIGGDHKGPWNFENCAKWYHGDPFSFMMQRNANYRCSYGPRSSNRLIGI